MNTLITRYFAVLDFMRRFAPIIALIGVSLFPSCATQDTGPDGPPMFAYDCEGGLYIVVEYRSGGDNVIVYTPDQSYKLRRIESASGAQYSDGTVTFWERDDEARLDLGDGAQRACTRNLQVVRPG